MNTQPEALRLADSLSEIAPRTTAELRRLHEVNQELVEEQQRMASQIATITHMLKTVNSAAMKLTSDLCRMEVDDDDRVSRDRVMERIVQWRNEWDKAMSNNTSTPLYTSPPRKKWVGLDDEDWMNVTDFQKEGCELDAAIYDWIEARLKEKNT